MLELIKFLQRRHQVTVAALALTETDVAAARDLARHCTRVEAVPWDWQPRLEDPSLPWAIRVFGSPAMESALRALNATARFDVVIVEHVWMADLARLIDAPAVLEEHNIESQILRRFAATETNALSREWDRSRWPVFGRSFEQLDASEIARMTAYEDSRWPRFPVRVVVSERDREEMERRCPSGRVVVVPNGVDTRTHRPVGRAEARGVLFTASFNYQPNLDAAAELCEVIWPLVEREVPEARLLLVGSGVPDHLLVQRWLRGAEVASDVDDLAPYASRCALSAVPLRVGGGTRLKILTSLALGLPVVTTSVGSEGLELGEHDGVLVEDDPARFAQRVVQILRDRDLQQRLARAGRAAVEEHYDWGRILPAYARLLEEVAGGAG